MHTQLKHRQRTRNRRWRALVQTSEQMITLTNSMFPLQNHPLAYVETRFMKTNRHTRVYSHADPEHLSSPEDDRVNTYLLSATRHLEETTRDIQEPGQNVFPHTDRPYVSRSTEAASASKPTVLRTSIETERPPRPRTHLPRNVAQTWIMAFNRQLAQTKAHVSLFRTPT